MMEKECGKQSDNVSDNELSHTIGEMVTKQKGESGLCNTLESP